MTGNVFRRFAQAALIVCLALPAASLLPASIPLATSKAHAAVPVPSDKPDTANLAEFKRVLSEYGAFATHPRYGEIWVPNVTPPGWHPYPGHLREAHGACAEPGQTHRTTHDPQA